MLEYYWAYADVNQMMDMHEEMMRSVVYTALGHTHVRYGEYDIDFSQPFQRISMKEAIAKYRGAPVDANEDPVRIVELFEEFAEPHLIQPTFITDFPKPVSPLSKASPSDPSVAERFEYFVGGLESANGFSELNDPEEQYQRFKDQVQQRERGDEEAMVMDEDYIRALSYGMPPAAGIGVGIDRLVMLLANKQSIRDVILFPHMRPERKQGAGDGSQEPGQ
jgi:lysyl-tRNA synthetase, class II